MLRIYKSAHGYGNIRVQSEGGSLCQLTYELINSTIKNMKIFLHYTGRIRKNVKGTVC